MKRIPIRHEDDPSEDPLRAKYLKQDYLILARLTPQELKTLFDTMERKRKQPHFLQ